MQSRFLALLLALLSVPIVSSAQTWIYHDRIETFPGRVLPNIVNRQPGNIVSVRELSIPEKARDSFQKGTRLLAAGDAAGSIEQFKQAIAKYHSYYEAYFQLGAAQLALGLAQDAADAFSKSIQISDGRFARPYFALSMLLSHDENFAEADTLAKVGLSLEPSSPIGQLSLGWAEWGLGRRGVAEKTLLEIIHQKPDFLEARLLLLQIHRDEHKLSEIVPDAEAYLKLDSSSATAAQVRALRDDALRSLTQSVDKPAVVASSQP